MRLRGIIAATPVRLAAFLMLVMLRGFVGGRRLQVVAVFWVCFAVMFVGRGSAWASASTSGFVESVNVPRVSGHVLSAYRLLSRNGFEVSVLRRWTFDASATPGVVGQRPAAGSLVAPGSAVELRVSCCHARRGHGATGREVRLSGLVGGELLVVVRWAKVHDVGLRATLGPLERATGPTLLANFAVQRAVLVLGRRAGHGRLTRPVLEVSAMQMRSDIGPVVQERRQSVSRLREQPR